MDPTRIQPECNQNSTRIQPEANQNPIKFQTKKYFHLRPPRNHFHRYCPISRPSIHHDDNKYVLHRSRDRCYQCVAIWPRHANALQFKAGDCNPSDSDLEELCNISPDVTLNTLVRLDSKPIDCPFQGPVSFSYNKGTGLCSSPLSELLPCMTPGQLKLRFHACPDIQQTESRGGELLPA